MEQRAPKRTDNSSADESRLASDLRSVWPGTLSDEARSNLLAIYRGIAGVADARPPAAPHLHIPSAWIERTRDGELVGVGGGEISLRVSAQGVERVSPEHTVISFVTPEAAAVEKGLRRVFCRHVRFFNSTEAASAGLPPGATVLTPGLAHRLGAIRNRIVFGDTLGTDHV